MTTSNKIPADDTATMPQVSIPTNSLTSDEDIKEFMNACTGQPASLDIDQVDGLNKWLDNSKVSLRMSLVVLSKPYDELKSQILNDRDLAVAIADVHRCAVEVEDGLELMVRLIRQSRTWMVTALAARPDCDEIMAKADDNDENGNDTKSHCYSVDDSDKTASKKGTYETVMAAHIKAIHPKFKALYDKYIFPGGSQLLTDPKSLGTETEALRNEILELQNRMPVESEEGMDCRLASDQLGFLIRLINAGLEFKKSDLITISGIVDQAGSDFRRALEWLALDEGGSLAENTGH